VMIILASEEQVFQPERMIITGKFNTLFLPDLDLFCSKLLRFLHRLFKQERFHRMTCVIWLAVF